MRGTVICVMSMVVAAAGAVFLFGCDDDSSLSDQSFRIDPGEVVLGQADTTLALTVVGGEPPFSWAVGNETLGQVTTDSRTVHYTRTTQNGVNTVTVTDDQGWTAQAVITQQDDAESLAISPTSATLDYNGAQVVFSGVGGTYPYQWSVGNGARGHLDSTSGSQTLYTRDTAEDNTVILTDKKGHVAVAEISQPDVATLVISPSSVTVSTNGTQVFTAAGGTPPYTWSIQGVLDGTFTPATGASTLYTSTAGGQDILQVTDAAASVAFATITKN